MKEEMVSFFRFITILAIFIYILAAKSWDLISLVIVFLFMYEIYRIKKSYNKNKNIIELEKKENRLTKRWELFITLFFS